MIKSFLLVGIGGALGSMLRYLFSLIIKSNTFPYATFVVNIIGCLAIGVIIGISSKEAATHANWKLFLATGICGGFTTFSAFSFECIQLMEQQRYTAMLGYIALSLVLGLAATFAGIQLTRL